jgi:hypothetical protein
MASIISSRMLGTLGAFYPSEADIQQAIYTADSAGQLQPAWANLAGHTDLACQVFAPNSSVGQEVKRADGTITVATHNIEIAGYYPAIVTSMRVVISSVNYDIVSVIHDSQHIATKLMVRMVA